MSEIEDSESSELNNLVDTDPSSISIDINDTSQQNNKQSIYYNNNQLNQTPNNSVKWLDEVWIGNFMPAAILLERNQINPSTIIDKNNGNNLLHHACYRALYNVIRTWIEKFNFNVNSQNHAKLTPLHISCTSTNDNIFVFSYLIRSPQIDITLTDTFGLTPVFNAVIHNFNFALLYFISNNTSNPTLIEKTIEVKDIYNNSLLYFAIVNNNYFATNWLLSHFPSISLNDKYYNNSSTWSDVLITNKNNQITKLWIKYYHSRIEVDSVYTCKRKILSFPFYNQFNYDLLNTWLFYKKGHFWSFIVAVSPFPVCSKRKITSNRVLFTQELTNDSMKYEYKMYNLYFMLNYLIIPNCNKFIKIWFYLLLIFLLLITTLYKAGWFDQIVYALFTAHMISFFVLLTFGNSLNNTIQKSHYSETTNNVIGRIRNWIMNQKIEELPNIDDICEICWVERESNDNHCYKCGKCVKDWYFHSSYFDYCINRRNCHIYLIYQITTALLFSYSGRIVIDTYENPDRVYINFLRSLTWFDVLFLCVIWIITLNAFKEIGVIMISIATKTPYYNVFKSHLLLKGKMDNRKGGVATIHSMNVNHSYIKNIFCDS